MTPAEIMPLWYRGVYPQSWLASRITWPPRPCCSGAVGWTRREARHFAGVLSSTLDAAVVLRDVHARRDGRVAGVEDAQPAVVVLRAVPAEKHA